MSKYVKKCQNMSNYVKKLFNKIYKICQNLPKNVNPKYYYLIVLNYTYSKIFYYGENICQNMSKYAKIIQFRGGRERQQKIKSLRDFLDWEKFFSKG